MRVSHMNNKGLQHRMLNETAPKNLCEVIPVPLGPRGAMNSNKPTARFNKMLERLALPFRIESHIIAVRENQRLILSELFGRKDFWVVTDIHSKVVSSPNLANSLN